MKTRKASLVLLLIVLGVLFTAQQCLAQRGCQTSTGTVFDQWVDPQASGTKLYGTLAIYYELLPCNYDCSQPNPPNPLPLCCSCQQGEGGERNMFFVLRLSKGNLLYSFSGDSGAQTVCYGDTDSQKDILFTFIQTVVRSVSPGSTNFALKAVDQVVDTPPPNFTMLDLTIAVQN
jgi:hypothetical protein